MNDLDISPFHLTTRRVALPAIAGLLLACTALTTSCDDGAAPDPGAVSLQWSAGPLTQCSDADLRRVEVHFRQGNDLAALHSFDCSEGGAFIDAVDPGRYDVAVRGIDTAGLYTFESVVEGVRVDEGERLDLGMVRMAARRAQVDLRWYFANARLCAQNHVDRVAVTVYDASYYEVTSAEFACETGEGRLDPLPAGAYTLDLLGLTVGDGNSFARGVVDIELERGEDAVVEVQLSIDE